MVSITSSSQISTFGMVKTILLSNSTISSKFNKSDIYEFEPRVKSHSFKGYPYIVVKVPELSSNEKYLGDLSKDKEFEIEIIMRMDYYARDNFTSYASNIINELENSQSDFQASGYYMQDVEFEGTEELVMEQKLIVEGRFSLILHGEVD